MQQYHSELPKPGELAEPRSLRSRASALRATSAQADPGCDRHRLQPRATAPITQKGSPRLPPRAPTASRYPGTPRGLSKSPGAVPGGYPPDTTAALPHEEQLRVLPQGGRRRDRKPALGREAPSPTPPPMHSPASGRSFPVALHAAVQSTSTPVHAAGATGPAPLPGPLGSRGPPPTRAHRRGGAGCPVPCRNFAGATSTVAGGVVACPASARVEASRTLPSAAADTESGPQSPGWSRRRSGRPRPHPRPLHLPAAARLQLPRLAPPADSTAQRSHAGDGGKADWNTTEPRPAGRLLPQ